MERAEALPDIGIEAETVRLGDFLRQGVFHVPWHQRYYDWEEQEVGDLLEDLWGAFEVRHGASCGTALRPCYFLGSVLLSQLNGNGADHGWDINDGQQRLVTFTLLLSVLVREILERDPAEAQLVLRCIFELGDRDAVEGLDGLEGALPRIRAKDDDKVLFRKILQGRQVGTGGRVAKAVSQIDRFLDGKERGLRDSSVLDLDGFRRFLLDEVSVVVLRMSREIDANVVFESLNARGKPLTELDRIRNHIYWHFSGRGMDVRKAEVRGDWERLERIFVVGGRTGPSAEHYVRSFFQCRAGSIPAGKLHRGVRRDLMSSGGGRSPARVAEVVGDLLEWAELFQRLVATQPDMSVVSSFQKGGRWSGRRGIRQFLSELAPYRVSHSLLFALVRQGLKAVEAKDSEEKERLRRLRDVCRAIGHLGAFVTRTALVSSKFPASLDQQLAEEAKRVMHSWSLEGDSILGRLRSRATDVAGVRSMSGFVSRLEAAKFPPRGKGMAKAARVLWGVSFAEEEQGWSVLDSLGPADCTVEHVLPAPARGASVSNHWRKWKGFADGEAEECVDLIGNMALLGNDENVSGAKFNGSFQEKRAVYKRSKFWITRRVEDGEGWTRKRLTGNWTRELVRRRSRWIAERADEVWSLRDDDDA